METTLQRPLETTQRKPPTSRVESTQKISVKYSDLGLTTCEKKDPFNYSDSVKRALLAFPDLCKVGYDGKCKHCAWRVSIAHKALDEEEGPTVATTIFHPDDQFDLDKFHYGDYTMFHLLQRGEVFTTTHADEFDISKIRLLLLPSSQQLGLSELQNRKPQSARTGKVAKCAVLDAMCMRQILSHLFNRAAENRLDKESVQDENATAEQNSETPTNTDRSREPLLLAGFGSSSTRSTALKPTHLSLGSGSFVRRKDLEELPRADVAGGSRTWFEHKEKATETVTELKRELMDTSNVRLRVADLRDAFMRAGQSNICAGTFVFACNMVNGFDDEAEKSMPPRMESTSPRMGTAPTLPESNLSVGTHAVVTPVQSEDNLPLEEHHLTTEVLPDGDVAREQLGPEERRVVFAARQFLRARRSQKKMEDRLRAIECLSRLEMSLFCNGNKLRRPDKWDFTVLDSHDFAKPGCVWNLFSSESTRESGISHSQTLRFPATRGSIDGGFTSTSIKLQAEHRHTREEVNSMEFRLQGWRRATQHSVVPVTGLPIREGDDKQWTFVVRNDLSIPFPWADGPDGESVAHDLPDRIFRGLLLGVCVKPIVIGPYAESSTLTGLRSVDGAVLHQGRVVKDPLELYPDGRPKDDIMKVMNIRHMAGLSIVSAKSDRHEDCTCCSDLKWFAGHYKMYEDVHRPGDYESKPLWDSRAFDDGGEVTVTMRLDRSRVDVNQASDDDGTEHQYHGRLWVKMTGFEPRILINNMELGHGTVAFPAVYASRPSEDIVKAVRVRDCEETWKVAVRRFGWTPESANEIRSMLERDCDEACYRTIVPARFFSSVRRLWALPPDSLPDDWICHGTVGGRISALDEAKLQVLKNVGTHLRGVRATVSHEMAKLLQAEIPHYYFG